MSDINLKLSDTQKAALQKLGVVLCYLHGSVADGFARNDSDVDIAVLFEQKPPDSIQAEILIQDILRGLVPERSMDVAVLNGAGAAFVQLVASRGIILYERAFEDRSGFEIRALHDYEASRRILDIAYKVIDERHAFNKAMSQKICKISKGLL